MNKKFLIVYHSSEGYGNMFFVVEKSKKFKFLCTEDIREIEKKISKIKEVRCVIINIIEVKYEKTN